MVRKALWNAYPEVLHKQGPIDEERNYLRNTWPHFLYPSQLGGYAVNNHVENNYSTILSSVKCSDHIVNNCLEPKVFYEDGLAPLFDASAVECNIEKMVNCDALATDESLELRSYDQEKIQQFESSIVVKDSVYVKLVWKENVTEVPSNYQVALKVLDRVYAKLDRTGNCVKLDFGYPLLI